MCTSGLSLSYRRSGAYDVRINRSLTTLMLVEVDLCYVFLYASFGTVTMLCI
jgi:hypothetical protein